MAITKPLGEISKSIPAAALRGDLGAARGPTWFPKDRMRTDLRHMLTACLGADALSSSLVSHVPLN